MLRYIGLLIVFLVGSASFAQTGTSTCRNATTYGADPSGVASSNAAVGAALAASDGVHYCVYFPQGRYRFSAGIGINLPSTSAGAAASVTFKGDGSETTQLAFDPGQNGIVIQLNSKQQTFHIQNLAILAGDKSSTTNGIYVANASPAPDTINPGQSDIDHVTVRGADGYHQAYRFGYGISLAQVSNVNIVNTSVFGSADGNAYASAGTCMIAQGLEISLPVAINVIGSQFNYCKYGIYYGPWLQGLQVSTTNFVGNEYGIFLPAGNRGNDQLAVSNSQFNNKLYDIYTASIIDAVNIVGNDFYGAEEPGTICINLNATDQFLIVGNSFINTGKANQNGIVIGSWLGSSGMITGNVFKNPFVTAIWLQSGSQFVNVQSNSYYGQTNQVINQGTNNHVGGGSN